MFRYQIYKFVLGKLKSAIGSVPENRQTKGPTMNNNNNQPTQAYLFATWAAMAIGLAGYLLGLWNTETMALNEKGFYFSVYIMSLYSAISLQKSIRDRTEGIPVTGMFLGTTWAVLGIAIGLMVVGLFNADLLLSQKGFFGMSFVLSLFAVFTVQKNIRDMTDENGNTNKKAYAGAVDGLETTLEEEL
jgi:uncharacterized membrane protein YiaA